MLRIVVNIYQNNIADFYLKKQIIDIVLYL
jgi:hypothetical protein